MARPQAAVGAPKPAATDVEHRRRLEALRDRLTELLEDASKRDAPPLAGQLRAVLNDLAALPEVKTEASALDDLAARRARGAGAPGSERPATG